MKKISSIFFFIFHFVFFVQSQNSLGFYTGLNMTFPDKFEAGNDNKSGFGSQLCLLEEFRKNSVSMQLRAGIVYRNPQLNFYNGGLGAGTTYIVRIHTTSLHLTELITLYIGENKSLYISAGGGIMYAINKVFTGESITHIPYNTYEEEVHQKDTVFIKPLEFQYSAGIGFNRMKIFEKYAFLELTASYTANNLLNEHKVLEEYYPISFYLNFGIRLF